jgi:hypothetical protein
MASEGRLVGTRAAPKNYSQSTVLLPANVDAEEQVLGAILTLGTVPTDVAETLEARDFHVELHRELYRVLLGMFARGEKTDVVSVASRFKGAAKLKIRDLAAEVGVPEAITQHAALIREAAERRRILEGAQRVVEAISGAEDTSIARDLLRDVYQGLTSSGHRPRLQIFDILDVIAEVQGAGEAEYLIEGKWPAGDYGVLGAEDKAGKTWVTLDLGVSVATGTRWLGRYECAQGPVLLFLGEGGKRGMERRLRAVCRSKGFELEELKGLLRVCFRVPRLTDAASLAEVRNELEAHPPKFSALDPLYLAAAGSRGSDLYAMGEALGGIQELHQDTGASFAITTHWNKTGEGSGAKRFTGVGPGAWGRVLASAEVESRRTDDHRTEVLLRWEFTGGEIPDSTARMRRVVWAEDPGDLSSELHYEVEITDELDGIGLGRSKDRPVSQRRTLRALIGTSQEASRSVREIGDMLARDGLGPPLQARTIQKALASLLGEGLTDGENDGLGTSGRWWITDRGMGDKCLGS